MSIESTSLSTAFAEDVRLFPLPDFVLFPHNLLPLHIFESRYREMLEDALQDDQLIAISTLVPGFDHDYYSRPPISPAICIGRVTDCKKTDQGTYNLALVGLQRAQIQHEIEPVRAFRRAKVKTIDDGFSIAENSVAEWQRHIVKSLSLRLPAVDKLIKEVESKNISISTLIDVLAFHLPLETSTKLQLLGEADIVTRAETLIGHLPAEKPRDGGVRRYPNNFSEN